MNETHVIMLRTFRMRGTRGLSEEGRAPRVDEEADEEGVCPPRAGGSVCHRLPHHHGEHVLAGGRLEHLHECFGCLDGLLVRPQRRLQQGPRRGFQERLRGRLQTGLQQFLLVGLLWRGKVDRNDPSCTIKGRTKASGPSYFFKENRSWWNEHHSSAIKFVGRVDAITVYIVRGGFQFDYYLNWINVHIT